MIMHLTQSDHLQDNTYLSLMDMISETVRVVWRGWSSAMEVVLIDVQQRKFSMRGDCPHCSRGSAFLISTSVYVEQNAGGQSAGTDRWVAGMQCQACMKYVLGIAFYNRNTNQFWYEDHYPLGKPQDRVDENVPKAIGDDFREALRCRWVKAYKATVVMCRRAVQTSALGLGSPRRKKLTVQIDDLFAKGKITEALKDFAHEVRLTGNIGAHPNDGESVANRDQDAIPKEDLEDVTDDLEDVTDKDADDIIEFTREY